MDQDALTCVVESMLFCSDKPVPVERMTAAFEEAETKVKEKEIREVIDRLKIRYADPMYGFELREAQSGFHFVTKAKNADFVRKFLATKPFRLGRSTLETLAIIAYRQPITRAEIDQVRGIDSSHLLRTLMERGLVKMAGKSETPGRPVQYATTPKFLEVVGLPSLSDLPPLSELDQLQGDTQDPAQSLEEGLEKFMSDTNRASTGHLEAEKSGLEEIEQMLDKVGEVKKEVYASPLHQEVAETNEAASKSQEYHLQARRIKPVAEEVPEIPPSESELPPKETLVN